MSIILFPTPAAPGASPLAGETCMRARWSAGEFRTAVAAPVVTPNLHIDAVPAYVGTKQGRPPRGVPR